VKNIRSPLMVLHGANDPRDPVAEADQLVAAIRAQRGSVEYLRFPDEGMGFGSSPIASSLIGESRRSSSGRSTSRRRRPRQCVKVAARH
jgi:hypothetical protein